YSGGSETNDKGEVADPTSNVKQPEQQVWAADVAGGEPRLLGNMNCSFEGCEDIEISPDGRQVVWAGAHELWIASVSGKEPARKLAYIRGTNSQPQWSPDGSQLAFISLTGSGGGFFSGQTQPWAIFVWDVASGKAKQIWQSANDA